MKFGQTIDPLSLIAFLLLRKVHCTVRRKADSLNYFDIPKFIKALECGLHFPLALDWCKHSAALNEGWNGGFILVTSSSLWANERQNHCCFSNCRSCFGLTLCFLSQDAILYFPPHRGKKILAGCTRYTRLTKLLKTAASVCSKLMLVICRSWYRVSMSILIKLAVFLKYLVKALAS